MKKKVNVSVNGERFELLIGTQGGTYVAHVLDEAEWRSVSTDPAHTEREAVDAAKAGIVEAIEWYSGETVQPD